MSTESKSQIIDDLMTRASKALSRTAYFEAERLANKALITAFQGNDFEQMARIVMPLQEARRLRVQLALEVGTITIVDEQPVNEGMETKPGCYLLRPPRVGADARRLRLAGLEQENPVAVVCHEPLNMLKLCPIVAITPGKSFRATMKPPNPEKPDMAWFVDAMKALGDAAIQTIDLEKPATRRVENLMECLDAIPDHEQLHQVLEATCREAMLETNDESSIPKASLI